MSPYDRPADQIVFRWDTDNLSGTTGFGPVACSCPPEVADAVFRTAAPLLRATGEATAPALLRLENGDQVLLVHRAPARDAGGRAGTVCHALMAHAAVLDPATCLGLHPWAWEGGDLALGAVRGGLPRVPGAALQAAADSGLRGLTGSLAGARHELVGAVAEFLRHPASSFTFLDPTGRTAHRVLWGLHGIFGGITRRWTFATHDTAETDRLRFLFVSRWTGEASGGGARRRVDPAERSGDRAESVAERLVRHQLREEYAVAEELRRAADHHRATRAGRPSLLALAEDALAALPPLDGAPGRPGWGRPGVSGRPGLPGRPEGHGAGPGYAGPAGPVGHGGPDGPDGPGGPGLGLGGPAGYGGGGPSGRAEGPAGPAGHGGPAGYGTSGGGQGGPGGVREPGPGGPAVGHRQGGGPEPHGAGPRTAPGPAQGSGPGPAQGPAQGSAQGPGSGGGYGPGAAPGTSGGHGAPEPSAAPSGPGA
ncbi:hypothetical protein AB0B42_29705, partial [Streptomyces fradiae]